ncbi:MAG: hypothetical protein ACMXYF_00110 [Candidatus Woesearchaeota archaeon]
MARRPLSDSFLLVAILGAIISGYYTVYGAISPPWGFTLVLMFIIFIIASIVSVTPTDEQWMHESQ